MHQTFFISDLHLGHAKVLEFSPNRFGSCIEEHDEWIVDSWNKTVGKKDTIWVLGDLAMSKDSLHHLERLKGFKKLVLGNHDVASISNYIKYFSQIRSMVNFKDAWLTHCPIHPNEFRKKRINVHGHVHNNSVDDPRYVNVCVEKLNAIPISWDEICLKTR